MTKTARQFDRRALFATGSAAALLATLGVSAQAAPRRGGHLRVALSGGDRAETWTTRPGGRFLQAARNAVFETLTEIAPDGILQPGLATAWTGQRNGAHWTFDIRRQVQFHDSTALTGHDVAASVMLHDSVHRAEADGLQVDVHLTAPDPSFPVTVAASDWPIFSAGDLSTGGLPVRGTGLYRIERFDPGRGFLGRRLDTHHNDGAAGWFETVELVAISDEAVRAEAVRDGYVDAADLTRAHDLSARADIEMMTDAEGAIHGAVRRDVLHAARLGAHPLDALRFATRWWMSA